MKSDLGSAISAWLKDYIENNNLECFVIGVSGGVDSAVVSTLCAHTGTPTIVLNLPINSKQGNTKLSNDHCIWLKNNFPNVKVFYMELSNVFETFDSLMDLTDNRSNLASANSKSRLRMMTLYHIATAHSGIVVGTGNKVEDFGVGFYTKYGDGGVDISPIADLTKTQVRALGTELQILPSILSAPPTDGLWEDSRTDEEQIGASYEELEWAMQHLEENSNKELTDRQQQVINIYMGFHNKNKHKMIPIPVFSLAEVEDE